MNKWKNNRFFNAGGTAGYDVPSRVCDVQKQITCLGFLILKKPNDKMEILVYAWIEKRNIGRM